MHSNNPPAQITLVKDCMMSWSVIINSSDAHTITNKNDTKPINDGHFCIINDHVWLAQNSFICKNVEIGKNNVIEACSTVTKSIKKENVTVAGNPAKIIKRNIDWDRKFN